jgi:hypothetical protein
VKSQVWAGDLQAHPGATLCAFYKEKILGTYSFIYSHNFKTRSGQGIFRIWPYIHFPEEIEMAKCNPTDPVQLV